MPVTRSSNNTLAKLHWPQSSCQFTELVLPVVALPVQALTQSENSASDDSDDFKFKLVIEPERLNDDLA